MAFNGLVTLIPSRIDTATVLDIIPHDFSKGKAARFILNITNVATDAGDTFDLYLQSRFVTPGGLEVWDDFVHFTQVLGTGTEPVRHIAVWQRDGQTPESEMHTPQAAAIAVGVVQGPIGPEIRANLVIVDADADGTITWSLQAQVIED